jgi:uroporphyrinogen III methyltransferase/synthase
LITVRGVELLARAEVVVYDYLSNPQLLAHALDSAQKIYVGKKAAAHTMTQEQINALLVELGLAGKRVVRLKGGDPFVFGRGGEECEALLAAGVPFEVVPGITAAIAAPAYAGIPVTHRDFNSTFTFVTGHEKEQADDTSDLDWFALARLRCLAFYMGVKSLPRICARLVEHGMDPATPAATIRWGTTPQQRVVTATVSTLPQAIEQAKLAAPALTIIGKVVSLRSMLNWFESRPLFGKTIVVTRTRQQASELSVRLRALGARVIEAPTIELAPGEAIAIESALGDLAQGAFDWVIFTSANGVRFARERLIAMGLDARAFGSAHIATIGEATADAVRRDLCLGVALSPQRFVAEALGEALAERGEIAGKRLLLLRADIARPLLVERLREGGAATVRDVAIYETRRPASLPDPLLEAIDAGEVDWLTFTSSSTARNFYEMLGPQRAKKLATSAAKVASIGPITSQTLRDLGVEPAVEASRFDVEGLVKALSGARQS